MRLTGKKILLAVTGGIAAYKSISLLRLLTAEGADVRVIPTPSAVKIAGFSAFETFSGHPVLSEVFSPVENPRLQRRITKAFSHRHTVCVVMKGFA